MAGLQNHLGMQLVFHREDLNEEKDLLLEDNVYFITNDLNTAETLDLFYLFQDKLDSTYIIYDKLMAPSGY